MGQPPLIVFYILILSQDPLIGYPIHTHVHTIQFYTMHLMHSSKHTSQHSSKHGISYLASQTISQHLPFTWHQHTFKVTSIHCYVQIKQGNKHAIYHLNVASINHLIISIISLYIHDHPVHHQTSMHVHVIMHVLTVNISFCTNNLILEGQDGHLIYPKSCFLFVTNSCITYHKNVLDVSKITMIYSVS